MKGGWFGGRQDEVELKPALSGPDTVAHPVRGAFHPLVGDEHVQLIFGCAPRIAPEVGALPHHKTAPGLVGHRKVRHVAALERVVKGVDAEELDLGG